MKKLIVPFFAFACVALAGGLVYANGMRHVKKYPDFSLKTVKRELSLNDVSKTNVKIQADVDYYIVYCIQIRTTSNGIVLNRNSDTTEMFIEAVNQDPKNQNKPELPQKFSWGTLNPR